MLFLGIVFLFPTSPQTDVPDMNYTVVVLGGIMILSVMWYYFPKYGGVHWFTGPIANVGEMTLQPKAVDVESGEMGIVHGAEIPTPPTEKVSEEFINEKRDF